MVRWIKEGNYAYDIFIQGLRLKRFISGRSLKVLSLLNLFQAISYFLSLTIIPNYSTLVALQDLKSYHRSYRRPPIVAIKGRPSPVSYSQALSILPKRCPTIVSSVFPSSSQHSPARSSLLQWLAPPAPQTT